MANIDDVRSATPSLRVGPAGVARVDEGQRDAFGRLRVASPLTLFDSTQLFDNAPLFWDDAETSGGGTGSAHSTLTAASTMSVSNLTAGVRVRQTFRRFNYEPGKSHLVMLTGVLAPAVSHAGITRRAGLFDENNGLFFEEVNGTVYFVRRTNVTGTPQDNRTALPTTYGSGETIDWSKGQILWIDMEWLGAGNIRCGLVRGGHFDTLHEEEAVNTLATVHMSTPNLPLRWEISNSGTGPAATVIQICSMVASEGGQDSLGKVRWRSTQGTHVDLALENTLYGVMGFRLKATHLGATVELLDVVLQLQTASSKVEWALVLSPTVTGGTYAWVAEANSPVEVAVPSTAPPVITNGIFLAGGFGESGTPAVGGGRSAGGSVRTALFMGSMIDGTPQQIWLCVRPIAGSTNVDVEAGVVRRDLI